MGKHTLAARAEIAEMRDYAPRGSFLEARLNLWEAQLDCLDAVYTALGPIAVWAATAGAKVLALLGVEAE